MSELHITPYTCPMPGCVGGLIADDSGAVDRCLHCAGSGLTDDPMGGADRAPRPPGVMRTPCADCAFRPGSPEREALGTQLPEDEPFYCHQGLPVSADGRYQPVATFRGLPLGAMVCAGWWALRTGEQLPAAPYREVPIGEDGVDRLWGRNAVANIDRLAGQTLEERERTLIATGNKLAERPATELSAAVAADVPGYRLALEAVERHQRYSKWAQALGVPLERAETALSEAFADPSLPDVSSVYAQARNVLAGGPVGGLRGLLEHVGIDTSGRDITVSGRVVDPWPGSSGRPGGRPAKEQQGTAAAVKPLPRMTMHLRKVLRVLLGADETWGAHIIETTRLPSGTVYPMLARLEKAGWITSDREDPFDARNRPPRRYVQLTSGGRTAAKAALARKGKGRR